MANEIINAENKLVNTINNGTLTIQNFGEVVKATEKLIEEVKEVFVVAKKAVSKLANLLRGYYCKKIEVLEKEFNSIKFDPEKATLEDVSDVCNKATKIKKQIEKYNKKFEKADKEAAALVGLSITAIAGTIIVIAAKAAAK